MERMIRSFEEVRAYYDARSARGLRDFLEGNDRVERAWLTVDQWAPTDPRRILEIGCGVGAICWRMSRRWPTAEVVGQDISSDSLEIARKMFASSRVSFFEGRLVRGAIDGQFDLVVLMDVYEHIAAAERSELHEELNKCRNADGRIILSFPTPRHLEWLRHNHPAEIQPIDEDITIDTIMKLALDTGTEVLLYQEVGIWHQGDYAHAVLGKRNSWVPIAKTPALVPSLPERLAMIRRYLDPEYSLD